MHIGNRIFPYPVLNQKQELSDYLEMSTFKVTFEMAEDGSPIMRNSQIIFKNLHYEVTDNTLLSLIEEEKVKGAFIVECSASVYRNKFDITSVPCDLSVSAHELNGNVVVSCYLYAAEDIVDFKSEGFIPEYKDYTFDIDKFDILAVDDGFKFKVEIDPSEDDKVASIFTVVKKFGSDSVMTYTNNDRNITIQLPEAFYDCYDNIKMKKDYNNIAFAMIAIPVLSSCLEELKSYDVDSIEELIDSHPWFNAVCISYRRKMGKLLTYDEFESNNMLELAQLVLNDATCNGIKDFGDMLLGTEEGADEDE